jgi:universal stress protein E
MDPINKILVIEDPDQQHPFALQRAIILAEQLNAQIELFACGYTPVVETVILFDQAVQTKAKQNYVHRVETKLREWAATQETSVTIQVSAQWEKRVAEGVLKKIEAMRPDLLVLHNHHHGRLNRLLSNYVEWELVKYSPVPLLLVRLEAAQTNPNTVVAIDTLPGDNTGDAWLQALECLNATKALSQQIQVIHCFQQLDPNSHNDDEDLPILVQNTRSKQTARLEELLKAADLPNEALTLLEGNPVETITSYIKERKAQLLVLGGTRKSLLEKVLLGSTLQSLMEHANCDIFVAKPH